VNLLIHADPGARSGFLAAWLTDKLTRTVFDVGINLGPRFHKIHRLTNVDEIKSFNGLKIRIRPARDQIDLLSLLFLRKNVYAQIPSFTRDEYSLETYTKLSHFAQDILKSDCELDYSVYDHVVDFNTLFDTSSMIEFYHLITGNTPTTAMINVLEQTNKINQIQLDKNHACSILKLIFTREYHLGLKEQNRLWSIVDLYNNIPRDQLYDTVYNSIKAENYGILS
jgi:hypothetical protein